MQGRMMLRDGLRHFSLSTPAGLRKPARGQLMKVIAVTCPIGRITVSANDSALAATLFGHFGEQREGL